MSLSWNEVRDRAMRFARAFEDVASEAGESQTFWNEFFQVFGRNRRHLATFQVAVKNIRKRYNRIDLLWSGTLLVEHKSRGESLDRAESQAFSYIADLIREGRDDAVPRFIIVSDFQRIALYDLESDSPKPSGASEIIPKIVPLSQLHKHVRDFAFIKGESLRRVDPQDPANEKAYARMCELHDALKGGGVAGPDLERLLVRILFCLFAEDTGVFEPNAFQSFLRERTSEDGADVGAQLNYLFDILNTPSEKRQAALPDDVALFPYVNGDLFAERLSFPVFTRAMRAALLAATDFVWAKVSPAVFGSLFQGVLLDTERRQAGAHYTSERDILRVIRSLFLDSLRTEFELRKADRSTGRDARLRAFHAKLRSVNILDPACGCGNFLIIAYRELRSLELDVLKEIYNPDEKLLDIRQIVWVDVDQFYGIEIDEWPARIAEVAIWLMDHQMNTAVSEAFGESYKRLPLEKSPHVLCRNALDFDWNDLIPAADCTYVLGNPPFVGKRFRKASQTSDMERVWGDTAGGLTLDYVTCWYRKAAQFIEGTDCRVAFVSTNSIAQGEQVEILWSTLYGKHGVKIHIAHRTFRWQSEARGGASVHVVIVGFGARNYDPKMIFEYGPDGAATATRVANISPYLIAGSDVVVSLTQRPLSGQRPISFGSMPNDGGYLLLSSAERNALIAEEPGTAPFIRPFRGSVEFINGLDRWCLWLVGVDPSVLRGMPRLLERVEAVREVRSRSSREATKHLAMQPSLFGEIRQPSGSYLAVPKTSAEVRRYIPIGFLDANVIASTELFVIEQAGLWEFGIVTSAMHMAWVRTIGGRLKSDYRYSSTLIYNNFPWPRVDDRRRSKVTSAAQLVLQVRERYLPPHGKATFADIYDPLSMPPDLVDAHQQLDRAVDRCYRGGAFASERERMEELFRRYEGLVGPLVRNPSRRAKR